MKVRTLAAVAALALGTAIGGAAHAATYLLTVDGCNGNGCLGSNTEIGTITVTQNNGMLNFNVALDNGAVFDSSGTSSKNNALVFDLNSGGASLGGLTYSNFTTVNASNNTVATTDFAGQSGSSFTASGFGSNWTNAVDYVGNAKKGDAESNFSFQLSDTLNNLSLSMLTFAYTANGKNIEFASDVYSNKSTGNVGAVYQSITTGGGAAAVPEPGTWGLMIFGVFAVGAMMRLDRSRARTAA